MKKIILVSLLAISCSIFLAEKSYGQEKESVITTTDTENIGDLDMYLDLLKENSRLQTITFYFENGVFINRAEFELGKSKVRGKILNWLYKENKDKAGLSFENYVYIGHTQDKETVKEMIKENRKNNCKFTVLYEHELNQFQILLRQDNEE